MDSIHNYEAGGRDLAFGLPVIVLVDGKSASAAEIVAAALQDRERAVVIGTSSFGKGSVQTVIRLPNDGEITLTWSRLFAPSGYMLHGQGVLPAICTSGINDDAPGVIRAVLAKSAQTEETGQADGETDLNIQNKGREQGQEQVIEQGHIEEAATPISPTERIESERLLARNQVKRINQHSRAAPIV